MNKNVVDTINRGEIHIVEAGLAAFVRSAVQSGNSEVLKKMNRTYDREWYIQKVKRIYELVPECAISSDMIAGFCGETEAQHKDTLSIMEISQYSMSYMFFYSERPNTLAHKKYEDDVPLAVKKARLNEIIQLQNRISAEHNKKEIGKIHKVLVEKVSKKSDQELAGRTSQNKMVVFPRKNAQIGTYVYTRILDANSATLRGELVEDDI